MFCKGKKKDNKIKTDTNKNLRYVNQYYAKTVEYGHGEKAFKSKHLQENEKHIKKKKIPKPTLK